MSALSLTETTDKDLFAHAAEVDAEVERRARAILVEALAPHAPEGATGVSLYPELFDNGYFFTLESAYWVDLDSDHRVDSLYATGTSDLLEGSLASVLALLPAVHGTYSETRLELPRG